MILITFKIKISKLSGPLLKNNIYMYIYRLDSFYLFVEYVIEFNIYLLCVNIVNAMKTLFGRCLSM